MRNRSFNFVVTRESSLTVARGAAFAGDAGQVTRGATQTSPENYPRVSTWAVSRRAARRRPAHVPWDFGRRGAAARWHCNRAQRYDRNI